MQLDTKAAARGKWQGILHSYGLTEKQLSGRHTECPVCGGKDRFRFDDKDGNGTFYCNHCGAGDGFSLLMRLRGIRFGDLLKEIGPMVGQFSSMKPTPAKSVEKIRMQLKSIMAGATREVINPYLLNRGINVAPNVWYHPLLPYFDDGNILGRYPAMLGIVLDADGESIALHRTYLTPDGHKANVPSPKKLTSPIRPIAGGAIRLFPVGECLGIAEGIETACAAFQLFGIPTWAAVSATMLASFKVPDGIKRLVIFGDNDLNGVGQQAADKLRKRYLQFSELRLPEKLDTDWADYL
jgi:putative DNA primase/helicase